MSIAAILSDALERADMSQKVLARRVGVSQSYISQICTGKKVPTIATLVKISGNLDMPMSDFFRDDPPAPEVPAEECRRKKLALSDEEEQIIELYRSMDKNGQRILKGIVSKM